VVPPGRFPGVRGGFLGDCTGHLPSTPLEPGRRPFHTLNPALAVLADGRVMAYSTMGGDGQPQTQAALFTHHVLYRQPLADAIERPRCLLGRTWGSPRTSLRLEARFDDEVIDRLLSAGHDVEVLAEPYSDLMGHAGAVALHPDGILEGAHDPRADGGAAGGVTSAVDRAANCILLCMLSQRAELLRLSKAGLVAWQRVPATFLVPGVPKPKTVQKKCSSGLSQVML
jgi:hypothetical protein